MNKQTELSHAINWESLGKRVLIGGGIGLVLISLLAFSVDHPHPDWPELWYIRPLAVVSLAGMAGGAFSYFMDRLSNPGWQKIVTSIVSLLVYIVALWLGTVLGCVGTLWN